MSDAGPLRFLRGPGHGDSESYEPFAFDAAGAVPKPALDAGFEEVQGLVHGLVRVLDDDGNAVGDWRCELDRDALITGFRDMLTVRAYDAAMLRAHRQGKTSFYMQSLGEEAVACAHRRALDDGDMCFPTYRQQGLLIAAGYSLVDMMNQVLSNSRDPLKGRQLPIMYSSKEKGFFSISGNLGTQYVQAVGWAMGAAIDGTSHIASAWIGEGATAESDFHAALVFASTFRAPVILNIVNNQWAISTHQAIARGAAPTFADRGLGFGIPAIRVDGNDYLAVYCATRWAAERARTGLGPTVIEWVTYRGGAHSTSDDPSAYRAKDGWASWPLGDPVERLAQHLSVAHGFGDDDRAALDAEIGARVSEALAEAESYGTVNDGPWPDPSAMFDDVYDRPTPQLLEQRRKAGY